MKINHTIIVGAGLSGAVIANRIKAAGGNPLIFEKRSHPGGNIYDYKDTGGLIIQKYGAHIFHTNYNDVWEYLSSFTKWTPYEHVVLSKIEGHLINIPFNLNSLSKLFAAQKADTYKKLLLETFKHNALISVMDLCQCPGELGELGQYVFDTFYLQYSKKQWGQDYHLINKNILARVPIKINWDDRYFTDKYQALPELGYTHMIKKMVEGCAIEYRTDATKRVKLENGKIYIDNYLYDDKLYWTASLDQLFNYKYGRLPYRSLKFKQTKINKEFYQPVSVVNFPNDHRYTRIIECKHLYNHKVPYTRIIKEYPMPCEENMVQYYPINNEVNQILYKKYLAELRNYPNIVLLGRLADYQYYNMDDAVKKALTIQI